MFAKDLRRALWSATVIAFAAAGVARADEPAATPAARPEEEAPAASPYAIKLQNGGRLALSGDYDGAIAALTEASQLEASRPEAFYFLGATKRLRGNLDGALEDFGAAARLAAEANNELDQARAMQAIAETLERVATRRAEARAAWADFVRFADAHRTVANPEVGRARLQAIDRVIGLDRDYEPVRQRIAERAAGPDTRRRRAR